MNRLDKTTEKVVRQFIALIADRFDIAEVIVYGSRARGTHRPDSDADVAVILRGESQRLLPTQLEMVDIAYDILLDSGIIISPLPIWLDQWDNPGTYSNPILLRNIRLEGVRL
ncbi:MAG: nucleotidyltransferase domain-containing protein [Moraxellaceae bacterium]|nr:nucleotidyltransferase domain-containing protein [Moraxellaceae bacterium]MDZ4387354.1 nucleotidyltransferase domain-containing protein [Moraxellaceae bacterium]